MIFSSQNFLDGLSNLRISNNIHYYLAENLDAYYPHAQLSLIVKGHVGTEDIKKLAKLHNLPHQEAQVRHDFAYEMYYRNTTKANAENNFLCFEFTPMYKEVFINGASVLEQVNSVQDKQNTVFTDGQLVPVTTLFVSALKKPKNSIEYVNQVALLDQTYIHNIMQEKGLTELLPELLDSIVEDLPSYNRGFFVDFYKNTHSVDIYEQANQLRIDFVECSPTLIQEIREASVSGIYTFRLSQEKTVHLAKRKRYGTFNISLTYDDEIFYFDQKGAVLTRNEHLLRRLEVSLQHGFALPIEQIRNNDDWLHFVNENVFAISG